MQNNNKRTLWLIGVIFLAPVFFALGYYQYSLQNPPKTMNRGQLVKKRITIPTLALNKWAMVLVAPENCRDACEKQLYQMQQIRLALGEEAARVERVLTTSKLHQVTVYTHTVKTQDKALKFLLLSEKNVELLKSMGRVFIVNPKGQVVLSYQNNPPSDDIYNDLKRLLKVSKNG